MGLFFIRLCKNRQKECSESVVYLFERGAALARNTSRGDCLRNDVIIDFEGKITQRPDKSTVSVYGKLNRPRKKSANIRVHTFKRRINCWFYGMYYEFVPEAFFSFYLAVGYFLETPCTILKSLVSINSLAK